MGIAEGVPLIMRDDMPPRLCRLQCRRWRGWTCRSEGIARAPLVRVMLAWVCLPFETHPHQVCDLAGPHHPVGCSCLCLERWRVNEGHLVDALASRGDEGRGTLRKASGSREQALIRGSPNGATHPSNRGSVTESIGGGGEPGELKHLSTRRKGHQPRLR